MIVPGAIPQIPGDMDAVITNAATLTAAAEHYAATGASVATTWQGLAPVYRAPEDAQLLAVMQPVMSKSADVHTSVSAAAAALFTYGNTVRPIKQRLAALQVEAIAFVGSVAGDDSWTKDQGKVDHNNTMLEEVDRLIVAWQDAQRACANSIDALYPGGVQYTVTTDGKSANQYGYTTDQLSSALHSDQGVPWGKTDTHDPGALASALSWVGNEINPINQLEGAWKSIKGIGTGLWTLVGGNGLDQAGQAWKGLGELGLALTPGMLELNSFTALPGIKQGELGSTLTNAGKSLIAWDDWKTHPGQAAGEVGVNIGTFFIPGAGEVAGGTKTAAGVAGDLAKASKAAVVAKVADLGAGLSDGAKVLPRVLRESLPGLKLPETVSTGGLKLDIASVDAGKAAPRLHLPDPTGTGPTEAERGLLPTHNTPADTPKPLEHTPTPTEHPSTRAPEHTAPAADHAPTHSSGPAGLPSSTDTAAPHLVSHDGSGLPPHPGGPESSHNPTSLTPPPTDHTVHISAADAPRPRTAFATHSHLAPDTAYHVEGRGTFYTDATGHVTHVETASGAKGAFNPDLNTPVPNATYVVDDGKFVFHTDASGHTADMQIHTLGLHDGPLDLRRWAGQSGVGHLGGPDYQGGHLAGTVFSGPGERINLVPMLEKVNGNYAGSFYRLERQWQSLLEQIPPAHITVDIHPVRLGDNPIPAQIHVTYQIDEGPMKERVFFNE